MADRIVRDEILTSQRYWSVSIEAQRLYMHLLLVVDDTARFSGKAYTIAVACFPGHQVASDKIENLLSELLSQDLIRLYEVDGNRFVFVPRFKQKLRYVNSKYPEPPSAINDINPDSVPDVTPAAWLKIRAVVLQRDKHKCVRCSGTQKLAAHHLTPRSKGGLSTLENLATLCGRCNSWAKANLVRCQEIRELVLGKSCSGTTQAVPEQDSSIAQVCRSEVKRSEVKRSKAKTLAPSVDTLDAIPPVICIPLNDKTEFAVTQAMCDEFEQLYPAVDVPQTLREIRGWGLSNPKNRKTRDGVLRHINSWLKGEQNKDEKTRFSH